MRSVVKLGGNVLEDTAVLDALGAAPEGDTVVVHGGGSHITARLEAQGTPVTFHQGRRVTTPAVLETVHEVLCASVQPRLVRDLRGRGVLAAGVAEARAASDGSAAGIGVLTAHRVADPSLGEVGRVTSVDTVRLERLLAMGWTPVVAPVASSPSAELLNVNADDAALAIATELRADRLILVSDVPGVCVDGEVLSRLDPSAAHRHLANGTITGGMRVKVEQALDAARLGLEVVIGGADALRGGGTRVVATTGEAATSPLRRRVARVA